MTTLNRTDEELFALVRAADPLPLTPPLNSGDVLLQRLLAGRRPPAAGGRGPRTGFLARTVLVAIGLAGLAFVLVSLLPAHGPGSAAPASAEPVIQRAAAALAEPAAAILHVDMTGVQTNADGTSVRWQDDSWQQTSAPFDARSIQSGGGTPTVETATVDGRQQLYDPAANTIYTGSQPSHPAYTLTPGPTAGTFLLHLPTPAVKLVGTRHARRAAGVLGSGSPTTTITITAAQAQALANGTDTIIWKFDKSGGHLYAALTVGPASNPTTNPDPTSAMFRQQILALLNSGTAWVAGPATIDGQHTLEIRSSDSHTTYYIDPATYAPVELNTSGDGGGVSLRFTAYEQLPDTAANQRLLSLVSQHPRATIDTTPRDYQAAQQRLFPNG